MACSVQHSISEPRLLIIQITSLSRSVSALMVHRTLIQFWPCQQLTVVPFVLRAASAANADNAANAVNAQNAVNATNATNAATAQNANSLGGVVPAGWAGLNVQNTGDLLTTGKLQITGNAMQSTTSNGLVKAMVTVFSNGQIVRCYNGITNSSTGNCGFTITQPLSGVYRIDFGFPVSDRFVSVSAQYCEGCFGGNNNGGVNTNIRHQRLRGVHFSTWLKRHWPGRFYACFVLIPTIETPKKVMKDGQI